MASRVQIAELTRAQPPQQRHRDQAYARAILPLSIGVPRTHRSRLWNTASNEILRKPALFPLRMCYLRLSAFTWASNIPRLFFNSTRTIRVINGGARLSNFLRLFMCVCVCGMYVCVRMRIIQIKCRVFKLKRNTNYFKRFSTREINNDIMIQMIDSMFLSTSCDRFAL